jgi:precorrin-4 methylase
LALPLAAMIMVVLRYLHEHYKNSSLYDADHHHLEDEETP